MNSGDVVLDDDPRTTDIGRTASRGALATIGGAWLKAAVLLSSTMVLARLLDPSVYGLIAMVNVVVGVSDLLRDFGMLGAILQTRRLSEATWSTLFWFSSGLGVLMMGALAAGAPLVGAAFADDRLVVLVLALAPMMLLNGASVPVQGLLQRNLRFASLARIDLGAQVVSSVCGIAAALAGFGVWALVVLPIAGAVFRLVALWLTALPPVRRPRWEKGSGEAIGAGASILGVQLSDYVTRNSDNVLIGRVEGAEVLGQYTRAYTLFLMPQQLLNGPLGRVAIPVMSALRSDEERYRRYVRSGLTVLAYLVLPIYAVLGALAESVVEILLGSQWGRAGTLLALLCAVGALQSLASMQGWIFLSLGRAHRQLAYGLATTPVLVGSFIVGLTLGGAEGLVLGYLAVTVVTLPVGYIVAIRGTFLTARDVAQPLIRPLLLAPLMFGAAYATGEFWRLGPWPAVLVGCLAALVPAALAMFSPSYRRDARFIAEFRHQVRRPHGSGPTDAPPADGTVR